MECDTHGRLFSPEEQPLRFVVKKHAASHPHYDLRLEWGGVLLSWQVPKGPSMDPEVSRLAVQVGDHSLDGLDFEGVIPDGDHGAGAVQIWDWGFYRPARGSGGHGASVASAVKQGLVALELNGRKLRGAFLLIRTGGRASRNWLLVKRRDAWARPGSEVTTTWPGGPRSVRTGRTIEEIASGRRRIRFHAASEGRVGDLFAEEYAPASRSNNRDETKVNALPH